VKRDLQRISAIISLGFADRIFTEFNEMVDLKELLEKIFNESFETSDIIDLDSKYLQTFGYFKNPTDIFTYLSSLKKLQQNKDLALKSYNSFIRSILEDTLKKNAMILTVIVISRKFSIIRKTNFKSGKRANLSLKET